MSGKASAAVGRITGGSQSRENAKLVDLSPSSGISSELDACLAMRQNVDSIGLASPVDLVGSNHTHEKPTFAHLLSDGPV
jgi:hypothetical protein